MGFIVVVGGEAAIGGGVGRAAATQGSGCPVDRGEGGTAGDDTVFTGSLTKAELSGLGAAARSSFASFWTALPSPWEYLSSARPSMACGAVTSRRLFPGLPS